MTRKLDAMKTREPEIPDTPAQRLEREFYAQAGYDNLHWSDYCAERIARSETREKVLEDALRSALEEYDSRKEDIMTMDYAYAIAKDAINKVRDALERKG